MYRIGTHASLTPQRKVVTKKKLSLCNDVCVCWLTGNCICHSQHMQLDGRTSSRVVLGQQHVNLTRRIYSSKPKSTQRILHDSTLFNNSGLFWSSHNNMTIKYYWPFSSSKFSMHRTTYTVVINFDSNFYT